LGAAAALLVGTAGGVRAGGGAAPSSAAAPLPSGSGRLPPERETMKARMSGKAADAQRVDDCKVPPERRGPEPRPTACRAPER
jgi:hypothetical protein